MQVIVTMEESRRGLASTEEKHRAADLFTMIVPDGQSTWRSPRSSFVHSWVTHVRQVQDEKADHGEKNAISYPGDESTLVGERASRSTVLTIREVVTAMVGF